MKKRLLSLAMCVFMLAGMAACQNAPATNTDGNGGNAATEEESGAIELTVWAEVGNFEMLNKMIDSFKAHYPDEEFEIKLVSQGDADVRNVMLGDVHNGADVFHFPDDQLNSLIAGGVLSAVPNASEVSSANIKESVDAASLNGTLYAYPMTADNGYFLYYDKNYFTEEDVKTMDGILAVAEKAGKKFAMELNSGWYMYSFFGNTGLQFGLNEDGVTNYCNWNTTEGDVTGIDIGNALVDIVSSPAFTMGSDAVFTTGIQDGSIIAGISGTWNATAVKEAWGDNYGAVKLPTYTCGDKQIQMASFTGYKMIGVNSYCENLEWAHKFADWITNEENQTLRFVEKNNGPSNIKASASDEVAKVPAIAAVIEQSKYGVLQRVGNAYWDACTSFINTLVEKKPTGAQLQELMDSLVDGVTASVAG